MGIKLWLESLDCDVSRSSGYLFFCDFEGISTVTVNVR
jgi:hypothetical protein